MSKREPFTMQLSEETLEWIEAQIRDTGCPRERIMETLAEESARMRRFASIHFAGPENARRAMVLGTGLDVWELVDVYESVGSVEELLEVIEISAVRAQQALANYKAYPEEIDRKIASNRRSPEEWHSLYPNILPDPRAG